jgi:DNA-directed RNA polymerase beta subunit
MQTIDDLPVDDLDTNLETYLKEILEDNPANDSVVEDPENADLEAGIEEIDAAFMGYQPTDYDSETQKELLSAFREVKTGGYPEEPPGDIDTDITTTDMMTIIQSEIKRKKIAGHHIDSMNSFNKVGIKQIATKLFSVEGRLRNQRDKTDEDRDIAEIAFKVEFTDINLTSPTTTKYKSGTVQMLTPGMAKIKNLTYSSQMSITAVATATAFYKNGTTKVRTATVENLRIASVPCETGTELCNTYNCSKETLKALEEDPESPGGFFIIKGVEWTIDNLENITNNTFHVYKNAYLGEVARGNFLSKPGDAFENSYQVILRYLKSGAITIEITTNKFDKFEIPYYIIFRALGMTRDKDIINHIVYGWNNQDRVTREMCDILERAFEVDDIKFGGIRKNTNPTEIIAFIAQRITEAANAQIAKKDDNIAKYLNTSILNIVDRFIFPHIGTGVEHRIKKLRFFGHLINKLLSVHMGIQEATDRDSYRNKRVYAAGTSVAKAFKTDFNISIVQEIKKHLTKDFKVTPFSQVQLVESIKAAITSDDLERLLTQSIVTGNKVLTVKRNEVTNRVSSQMMYHKNDMNVKSTLGTINTPNTTASKQNERADEMRRVHPSFTPGFIDPSQSADSGEKVGTTKQMGCTASICGASSSFVLKKILADDPLILPLDDVTPEQITEEKLAKVFVNGDWIGCCRESHKVVRGYRTKRRYGDIHHQTTIVWEQLVREVYFWTDVGRMMRPLVIVYNNLTEYTENWRHGDRSLRFKQWIKLTKQHLEDMRRGKITMDDLRQQRVIEYISPEEQENTFIAPNINELRAAAGDLRRMYTHCDIDQAIFGIVTLASPMCNHSNATRITYYTNHRKQSAGWFALNYPYRIDKNVTFQHYCERPLVSVISDTLTYPNGLNTIVAIQLHGGENCEDSVKSNQSSVDCGMYNASHYNFEKTELEKGEDFGNPDYARTMDIKKDATYEFIKGGFIAEGTVVNKGHVLVVKAAKILKPTDNFLYNDKSIVYSKDEPVIVERVIVTRNDEDALMCKVKLRADRPLGVGDKLSCFSPDHDVLTARGWVPIAEVTLQDEVATLQDGEYLVYDNPLELHQYDHKGDMYIVDSLHIRAKTTLNHRMYVAKEGKPFGFETAEEIRGKHRFYKTTATLLMADIPTHTVRYEHGATTEKNGELITGGQTWPDITFNMDDWLEFLGIWISDGNLVKANHCQVQVTCIKGRKIKHLQDVCQRLGLKLSSHGKNHYFYSSQVYSELQPLNRGAPHKYLPDYVWNLSQRQARILLAGLISGDGCINAKTGHIYYCTASTRLADDLQRLITHCGWVGYKQLDKPEGHQVKIIKDGVERTITAKYNSWKISVNKSTHITGVNGYGRISDRTEPYDGKVYCLTVAEEVFYVRHKGKCWWSANSRSGNKGICSIKVPRMDLPFCEDGLVPDKVINAHSFPTRMALNQNTECLLGQVAARFGVHIDATSFREHDFQFAIDLLAKEGIKYGGHRRMYDGLSGDWIDRQIFIGPTVYQRLQKFVIDEQYATRGGPTSAVTKQPLDGKINNGGLKVGEMEKDVFVCHGVGRAMYEKMYEDSDGKMVPICRGCSDTAIVNPHKGIYKCSNCGDNADIAMVASSWGANLAKSEFKTMNTPMKWILEPHMYDAYGH